MPLELDATMAAGGGALDGTATDAGARAAPTGRGTRDPAASLPAGTLLAHFRIDAPLGRGGMGEVYRATDLALDRPVAIKVLPPEVARDAGRRERLFREARAQARLQHPNVCHIYYVGQQDGIVFFAMELVAGETLAERVARGPLAAAEAVELVRQAALGLREAHRHGFTHRDVKPSNVMVDREGRVKVVDFGLVKVAAEAGAPVGGARAPAGEVAATGFVGTPLYMAPEQVDGVADQRADIYALGATLHHLIAGRPPFEGATVDELATQHRVGPRPALAADGRRARALSAVDAVIARMMAKRPEDRFAGYDELIAALERVSTVRTRPAGAFVRALAALIDALVLVLAFVPVEVALGLLDREIDDSVIFVVAGPLYTTVALSRWGTTVGRWLLEIEVVTVGQARRPSPGAAAIRHLVEYGGLTAAMVIAWFVDAGEPGGVHVASVATAIAGLAWGIVALTYAAIRTPDKRTAWDRAAGTMTRYRTRRID